MSPFVVPVSRLRFSPGNEQGRGRCACIILLPQPNKIHLFHFHKISNRVKSTSQHSILKAGFKYLYKKGIYTHLRELRMQKAAEWLSGTDKTLK